MLLKKWGQVYIYNYIYIYLYAQTHKRLPPWRAAGFSAKQVAALVGPSTCQARQEAYELMQAAEARSELGRGSSSRPWPEVPVRTP